MKEVEKAAKRLLEQHEGSNVVGRLKELVASVEQYLDVNIGGSSYECIEKSAEGITNAVLDTQYMSDKDWLEKYCPSYTEIPWEGGPEDGQEFDEEGMFTEESDYHLNIQITYIFNANDGGKVVRDFYGLEDTEGNVEIHEETDEADKIETLLLEPGTDVDTLYKELGGK